MTEFEFWSAAEDRFVRELTIAKTLSAQVGLIVHSLTDLNAQITKGQPFFLDIVEQGIALYEAEGLPSFTPLAFAADNAALVRWLIISLSCSAIAAIKCSVSLFA